MIAIRGLCYSYPSNARRIINNFSLDVQGGAICRVVGDNGSGKSTLLKLLAGKLQPVEGTIRRTGVTGVAYLDQNAYGATAPDLTVGEHIRMCRASSGVGASAVTGAVASLASRLGQSSKPEDFFVGHLSGGQRQVVALMMAAASDANFFLLDEFTAAMDPETTRASVALLSALVAERDAAVLYVSHRDIGLDAHMTVSLGARDGRSINGGER